MGEKNVSRKKDWIKTYSGHQEYLKTWRENLSPEEEESWKINMSNGLKNFWERLTEDEKDVFLEERLSKMHKKSSRAMKDFWENLTEKERQEFLKKRGEAISVGWQKKKKKF